MLVAVNFGQGDRCGGVNAVEALEEPPLEGCVQDHGLCSLELFELALLV